MLGETGGSGYGTLEWMGRAYVDGCLRAWLEAWSGEIKSKLATPFDTVYFDVDELQRPGMAETMASLRTAVEAGFMTRNEAREELDMEPLPGLDAPIQALNMGTGGGTTNIVVVTNFNVKGYNYLALWYTTNGSAALQTNTIRYWVKRNAP